MPRKIAGGDKGWTGYGPKLAVTFHPEHFETLRQIAEQQGVSMARAVREVIADGLRARQGGAANE